MLAGQQQVYNQQMPAFMHCGDEENNLAEHPQDDDVVQISTTDATSYFHAASHAAKQVWILVQERYQLLDYS